MLVEQLAVGLGLREQEYAEEIQRTRDYAKAYAMEPSMEGFLEIVAKASAPKASYVLFYWYYLHSLVKRLRQEVKVFFPSLYFFTWIRSPFKGNVPFIHVEPIVDGNGIHKVRDLLQSKGRSMVRKGTTPGRSQMIWKKAWAYSLK